MIICAVPVKDLVNAKQRLIGALGPAERTELARAMLRDVVRALVAARLDRVWVVTRDADVTAIAHGLGAEPLAEAENRGHTAAVAFAQTEAARRGARCLRGPGKELFLGHRREGPRGRPAHHDARGEMGRPGH